MKRFLALLLVVTMMASLVACSSDNKGNTEKKTETPTTETPADNKTEAPADSKTEAPADNNASTEGNVKDSVSFTDTSLFKVVEDLTKEVSFNEYYGGFGIDCNMKIRSKGSAQWIGEGTVPLQTAKKKYKIGYSAYYTIDEVSAMYLAGIQDAAKELGVELLVNDANYDQNHQNQAIEQWITEGVDAVILSACDFYGIKPALDALEKAGIPTVTYDSAPCAGSIDSCVVYDAKEQGRMAAEILEDHLKGKNAEMKGTIYYGTLPFVHPNAVTREAGFHEVFDKYPDIKIKALTGNSPEDHYTAFEGILMADKDIIGLWGLYSSATYGIMNVVKATGVDYPITSVDNDRVILEGISKGEVVGSCCTNAIEGSRLAMLLTIKLIEGEEVPGIVYQTNTKVGPDNVEKLFPEYYHGQTLAEYSAGQN